MGYESNNMITEESLLQHAGPRGLVVAGLSGGSGKSVVAVGLVAAFSREGRCVVPFKKGPDYIDAGWLHIASGRSCYNLDPYPDEKESDFQFSIGTTF